MVARHGSPAIGGLSMKDPHPHPRATIKAHRPSTLPLSPLRNPDLVHRLMPISWYTPKQVYDDVPKAVLTPGSMQYSRMMALTMTETDTSSQVVAPNNEKKSRIR